MMIEFESASSMESTRLVVCMWMICYHSSYISLLFCCSQLLIEGRNYVICCHSPIFAVANCSRVEENCVYC